MRPRLIALGLAGCAAALGQANFVWDYPTNQYPAPAVFTVNGDSTFMSSAGGGLIYTPAVSGANANNYEMRTVLSTSQSLAGGTYMHFLRASSNAAPGVGSYISVEFAVPSGWQTGGTAPLTVNQSVGGTITLLGSSSAPIHNGDILRSVVWGTTLWVFVNNTQYFSATIPLTTGQPGYGGHNQPYANLTAAWVGHHDTVTPAQLNSTAVATSIFPTAVSLKWQGVPDDSVGIGVYEYYIARNGTAIGKTPGAEFTDSTVLATTTYTYTIQAVDYHGNLNAGTTVTVTTPAAGAIDPRRTGVYTTGSYWGGGGEQIDTLSGNLNFSLPPLLTAQGRAGWTVPVGLVYNSQNWRQDGGVNWKLGADVGYGFGWQMLIGSITPYYASYYGGVDHYVYTDSTGAQYRLTVNNGGVWSGTSGVYVWFDSNTDKLHFKDGSFWVMGCTSGGSEADAGTMYPTVIEDVSGNQVIVEYYAGSAGGSARISQIYDSRSPVGPPTTGPSYAFYYNSDTPVPHLTSTWDYIGTGVYYSFTYNEGATLEPPFGPDPNYAGLTTTHLSTVTLPTAGPWQFTYDTAGAAELLQATFPWGGHLRWTYATDPYSASRDLRAVSGRYLAADSAGATEWSYGISRDNASASGAIVHGTMTLSDASGVGAKTWNFFNTSSSPAWETGLASEFVQSASSGGTVLQDDLYTWSQDPAGNPYISTKASTTGQGTSNLVTATSTQTLDQYGNVTQSVVYPYNNTTTPLKTYNNTFLGTSTYTSNYIFNRLVSSSVTPSGGSPITLVTNTYDSLSTITPVPSPTYEMDPSPPIPANHRGYLNSSVTPAATTTTTYFTYGSAASVTGSNGTSATASADSSTNFAAPVTITSQSYTTTMAYNSWLGVTQTTGQNGEQLSMSYDSYGRPTGGISPYGAGVGFTYGTSVPFTQTKTGPDGRTVTTLDGLGRAIQVDRGDTTSMQSSTATVYAPCACSPLAKIQKTSQPYTYGGSASAWTTYTYDGLGRPLTVQQPDGASTTTYLYSGNVTTVTDPASKWKQFTTDVSGNLITVTEPDPANPPSGTLTTTYTYDWMNHVIGVSMARAGTTQTRSFVYDNAGRLTSATNPENGTVSYVYGSNNAVQKKTDAKGQQTVYSYDSLNRLTMTQYYPTGTANPEDGCQRVTYSYDTNPINPTFSQNSLGRLTAVQYGAPLTYASGFCISGEWTNYYAEPGTSGAMNNFTEMYSYHPAGAVTAKQLALTRSWIRTWGGTYSENADVEVDYSYDNAGRVASTTYPMAPPFLTSTGYPDSLGPVTLTYGYDSMGRPNALTDNSGVTGSPSGWTGPADWVQNVQYDYAGRMTSLQYTFGFGTWLGWQIQNIMQKSMTYNVNGQLTSMGYITNDYGVYGNYYGPSTGLQYNYSATQNNGQITQEVNTSSGETISYQYDALKRLTSASSSPNSGSTPAAYTQTFQYDGFGNLTAKVLNGTTTSIPVTAATNRLSSASYDLNGNMTSGSGATMTYDEANRISSAAEVSGGIEYYGYTADNKRFYTYTSAGTEQMTFYGAYGEKLGVYSTAFSSSPWGLYIYPVATNMWFAGKLILESNWSSSQDRLGSTMSRYYPYGEEIAPTSNDRIKFATYTRDSYTGFDYADQRYYASTYGRFNTPDPAGLRSAHRRNPSSWNRYSYAGGDPVNGSDPTGLDPCEAYAGDDAYSLCIALLLQSGANSNGGGGASLDSVLSLTGDVNLAASGTGVDKTYTFTPDGGSPQTSYGYQVLPDPQVDAGIAGMIGTVVGGSTLPVLGIGTAGAAAGATGYLGWLFGLGSAGVGAAETPEGQQVEDEVVGVGTTVYRVFGGTSPQMGQFWTTVDPTTVPNYPNAAGLPPGNTAEFMVTGFLNDLTGVTTTIAARIGNNLGGLPEVNVPNSACQITVVCVSPFQGIP